MIHSGVIRGDCPICQVPGAVCGDNHMRRPPVDNIVNEGAHVAPEPQELAEYKYVVNNMITTAMLTPKMAEQLGAVPVGDDAHPNTLNGGYTQGQNQAVYAASDMNTGVVGDGAVDPIRAQQQGIDDEGRTPSMLPPVEDTVRVPNEAPVEGPNTGARTDVTAEPDADAKSVDAPAKTRVARNK